MSHFRRTERAPIVLRAELRRGRRDAALVKPGEVSDLSVGGAYIVTTAAAAMGEEVWIRFVAPTAWEPLDLRGEVRWVEPGGFGVAFAGELSEAELRAVRALVDMAGFAAEPA
jgi:Tfp pilus assembly protein PilZ